MSESSPAVGSLPRRATHDYFPLCNDGPSEKHEQQDVRDEDAAWASVARRSRGSRALPSNVRQNGMSDMFSRSTEAPNHIESVPSSYALLVGDEDDDRKEDGDADSDEERSVTAAPKPDAAAASRRRKGSKAGKERAGSGQKTTKSRATADGDQEWPQEAELVATPEVECSPAVSSEEVSALRGKLGHSGSLAGCSASGSCRLGGATRCSGSAPPAMATMAFAAELLAIVAGIAPERHETRAPKGQRRAQPRPQLALAMQRPQNSAIGSVRQPCARGGRK